MSPPCPSCGHALEAGACPRCAPRPRTPSVVLAGLTVTSGTLLMTVVAVLAARAIPPGIDAQAPANEAAAREHLDAIAAAQVRHLADDADRDGAQDYASLDELAREGLVHPSLRDGPRSNYVLSCEPGPGPCFAATAAPLAKGDRHLAANDRGERYVARAPFGIDGGRLRLPPDAVPLDR